MTENLKFIVQEVNSLLGTDYNLISFDSLTPDVLLQVLVDVFAQFGATEKVKELTSSFSFNFVNFD